MASKPATIIKIALHQDGRVQCGLEGVGDRAFVARGLAVAMQSVLNKLDEAAKEPTIDIPDPGLAKQLLGAR